MTRGKKPAAAMDAPLCARVAHEQLETGISAVFLPGSSIPLGDADKNLLRFLAGRDKRKGEALALWGTLQELAGDVDEYEMVVSENFLWVVLTHEYSRIPARQELQDADDKVAEAAEQLRDALQNHPDLGVESAALNWPAVEGHRIANGLRGLRWGISWEDEDRMRADEERGVRLEDPDFPETEVTRGCAPGCGYPEWDVGAETNSQVENGVLIFVLSYSPTMSQMAAVLARRARQLSSTRLSAPKRQTSSRPRFYAKWIVGWLLGIYPKTIVNKVASICAPIVSTKFNLDIGSAFELCKNVAEELKKHQEEGEEEGEE